MLKTPREYSFFIALIITVMFAVFSTVFGFFQIVKPLYAYLITGSIIFFVTFLIVRLLFVRFVEEKINPIYKTIHTSAESRKQLRERIKKKDIVTDINNEVAVWANNQSEEIKKLKQLEKYRKDFLGNVSHELKTPIFNVQGYILTLLDGGMEDSNINRLYLEKTEKSINRLISIIDDLDSISRLESGEFKLHMESFNIVRLVEDIFESQEIQAKQFNIKLSFDANYNRSIKVYADKKRITEVISNLIVNSVKYGKKGGKTVVGFIDTGESVLVDITDNGIGIEEDDLPRIFERFYRVDRSRSRDSGGTGLGLSIVKHIIQAHSQTINVRSKPGKGTSFIFSLDKA